MKDEPVHSVIARLRRAQPINKDTQRVCDELERAVALLTKAGRAVNKVGAVVNEVPPLLPKKDQHSAGYMRDYMRRRRAAKRVTKAK